MNHTNDPTTAQAAHWLAQLDRTLAQSDLVGAVALFGDEYYGRDLIAFTWNIVTLESREAIREMLAATRRDVQPSGWTLTEPATEQEGVVEGWFSFETAVGRGRRDLPPARGAKKERDADFYARLAAAGFQLDFGPDESGQGMKAVRNGGGFYIDVGASELIITGAIKLRSGVGIARIREESVVLSDGSELPADLIIYATGYGAANEGVAKLISQETATKVGKVWGLGTNTAQGASGGTCHAGLSLGPRASVWVNGITCP